MSFKFLLSTGKILGIQNSKFSLLFPSSIIYSFTLPHPLKMGWRGEEKRHEVWKFTAQTSKAARVGQLLPSRCWLALEKSFAPLFRKGKRFLRTSWTLLESSSHHQLRKACDVCKRQVEHPELEVKCERKWSSPKQRGVKPREAASSASVSHCVPIGHFKIRPTKPMPALWAPSLMWKPFPVGVLRGRKPGNLLLKTQSSGN